MIAALDEEIARLEEARRLLAGSTTNTAPTNGGTEARWGVSGKRTMSAEGRARIAAAQKKRWAKAKRAK
jgi:hypothetical protein